MVELDNCPLITDVTLEHLKSCHRLERIELYDCQQVTRAGIKRIRVTHNSSQDPEHSSSRTVRGIFQLDRKSPRLNSSH